jgi:hypothetical protein
MWLVWETKVVEYPLWYKLVGIQYKGRRPKEIILTEEEQDELHSAKELGDRYKSLLKGATRRCPT